MNPYPPALALIQWHFHKSSYALRPSVETFGSISSVSLCSSFSLQSVPMGTVSIQGFTPSCLQAHETRTGNRCRKSQSHSERRWCVFIDGQCHQPPLTRESRRYWVRGAARAIST